MTRKTRETSKAAGAHPANGQGTAKVPGSANAPEEPTMAIEETAGGEVTGTGQGGKEANGGIAPGVGQGEVETNEGEVAGASEGGAAIEFRDVSFTYRGEDAPVVPHASSGSTGSTGSTGNSGSTADGGSTGSPGSTKVAKPLALSRVSLSIPRGSAVLITGPSGCGKSTALRMMNGLIPHVTSGALEGSVVVDGLDAATTALEELGQHTATVFQNPRNQFFAATVLEELAFARQQAGQNRQHILEAVHAAARRVGINGWLDRSLWGMSGGELQAVACATALAGTGSIYLFDEPTSNLSDRAINAISQILGEMKRSGATLVVAEHRLYFLHDIVDTVITMEAGRVQRVWEAEEFFATDDAARRASGWRTLTEPEIALVPASTDAAAPKKADRLDETAPYGTAGLDETWSGAAAPEEATGPNEAAPGEITAPSEIAAPSKTAAPSETSAPHEAASAGAQTRGLTLHDLRYSYGNHLALDIDRLHVPKGAVTALMGDNGAGKTTLCRVITGLADPERTSTIEWDGERVSAKARRAMSSIVMQDVNRQLFAETVLGEVTMGTKQARDVEPRALLARLGLDGFADRHPMSLSGGQKQRLVIAAALAARSKLVVFDEPTSGVDYRHMLEINSLIRELAADDVAVLVVSHDREFVAACADRVVRLSAPGAGAVGGDGSSGVAGRKGGANEAGGTTASSKILGRTGGGTSGESRPSGVDVFHVDRTTLT